MLLWKLSHRLPRVPRSSSTESASLHILTLSSISVSEYALLATLSMLVWIPRLRMPLSLRNRRRRGLGDRLLGESLSSTSIVSFVCFSTTLSFPSPLSLTETSPFPMMSVNCFLFGNGDPPGEFNFFVFLNCFAHRTARDVPRKVYMPFFPFGESAAVPTWLADVSSSFFSLAEAKILEFISPGTELLLKSPLECVAYASFSVFLFEARSVTFRLLASSREFEEPPTFSLRSPPFRLSSLNLSAADFFDSASLHKPLLALCCGSELVAWRLPDALAPFAWSVELRVFFLLSTALVDKVLSDSSLLVSFASELFLSEHLLVPSFSGFFGSRPCFPYSPYFSINWWITSFLANGLSWRSLESFLEKFNSFSSTELTESSSLSEELSLYVSTVFLVLFCANISLELSYNRDNLSFDADIVLVLILESFPALFVKDFNPSLSPKMLLFEAFSKFFSLNSRNDGIGTFASGCFSLWVIIARGKLSRLFSVTSLASNRLLSSPKLDNDTARVSVGVFPQPLSLDLRILSLFFALFNSFVELCRVLDLFIGISLRRSALSSERDKFDGDVFCCLPKLLGVSDFDWRSSESRDDSRMYFCEEIVLSLSIVP